MISEGFQRQLRGYGLTMAEIWYTKPGCPQLINPYSFTWQDYDICPDFPKLFELLRVWQQKFEGKPVIVKVAHSALIQSREFRAADGVFRLH
ncbi:MAG TPA: protein usg [Candidatus Paceibacterota bacterium]|jgi:uncharacterized protein Usg|nr:protein usg [Candidatus Paceibacterota bacterium]